MSSEKMAGNLSTNSSQRHTIGEVLSKPRVALVFVFLLLLMLLVLVGNFLVFWTILRTRRLRFSAFYFVASLAVSDFLVGVLVLPISLAYHLTFEMESRWIFGSFTCKAWLLANFWFCSASILNLCLVSWDRYVAVTSSLLYQTRMSDIRIFRMIGVSWTVSLGIAIILITGVHFKEDGKPNCTVQGLNPIISATGSVFVFIVPVFFLIFVNIRVWLVARSHMKRIHVNIQEPAMRGTYSAGESVESSRPTNSVSSAAKQCPGSWSLSRTIRQEIKTFKTFLIVIGVFVLCWTPFYAVLITANIVRPVPGLTFYLTIIISYCNSAVNVFIYGTFNRDFRKALVESLKCTKIPIYKY